MTLHRDTLDAIQLKLTDGQEHLRAQRYGEARAVFEALGEQLAERDLTSAWLLCGLAETWRHTGELTDLERAFELCCAALVLDPVHPWFCDVFSELAQSLREQLATFSTQYDQPHAPRLYATLQRVGETDAASHLALARFYAGTKAHDRAITLLRATLLLDPTLREAWLLWAELCEGQGRAEEAAQHRAKAEHSAARTEPFAVPAVSRPC